MINPKDTSPAAGQTGNNLAVGVISGPLRRYNLAWHLARIFLPLITRLRARKGKEDAQRLDEILRHP